MLRPCGIGAASGRSAHACVARPACMRIPTPRVWTLREALYATSRLTCQSLAFSGSSRSGAWPSRSEAEAARPAAAAREGAMPRRQRAAATMPLVDMAAARPPPARQAHTAAVVRAGSHAHLQAPHHTRAHLRLSTSLSSARLGSARRAPCLVNGSSTDRSWLRSRLWPMTVTDEGSCRLRSRLGVASTPLDTVYCSRLGLSTCGIASAAQARQWEVEVRGWAFVGWGYGGLGAAGVWRGGRAGWRTWYVETVETDVEAFGNTQRVRQRGKEKHTERAAQRMRHGQGSGLARRD